MTILEGKVQRKRKRGRQKRRWQDNIDDWTVKVFSDNLRRAKDTERWRELVADIVMSLRSPRLQDI